MRTVQQAITRRPLARILVRGKHWLEAVVIISFLTGGRLVGTRSGLISRLFLIGTGSDPPALRHYNP